MPADVCPGGHAVNVDRERWVAQCPGCAYTFSTLMDDPVVPPHYVTADGVTFVPVAITCPRCGMTSYNPNDVRERYCGHCHDWTGGASGRTGEEDRGLRRDAGPT
jgi:hypothetical protein